jgi:allantoicase
MDDIEYKLEAVKATRVPADDIDTTLRSGCLGS